MDDYSRKKAGDGLVVSRKVSSLVLRETPNSRDRNVQFCNRIGCNGIRNSTKSNQINCTEKAKSSRPSLKSSSSGKEIIGSSSRTRTTIGNPRKTLPEPRKKLSSQLETDSSETGSVAEEPEISEFVPSIGKIQRSSHYHSDNTGTSETTSMEVGSSSLGTSTRSRRNNNQKSALGSQDVLLGPCTSLTSRSTSQGTRTNTSRYGVRSLHCSTLSDATNSGSAPDANLSRKKDMVKKRISDGESSSSARGKKMGGSSLEWRNSSPSSGISISDARRPRSGSSNRDNSTASVRTRRSVNGYTRARTAIQGSGNHVSLDDSNAVIPETSLSDDPLDLNTHPSSYHSTLETAIGRPSSYCRSGGSSSESSRLMRPSSPVEGGSSRSSINRENFRRYNIDGIAEVLLTLERFEQDEELSYEQLLVLETNLFLNGLSGLNFYDQHREMRLDIDNMSYEELLALEERMGSVSTALTEEALSECLKTSIYQPPSLDESTSLEDDNKDLNCDKDDVKCSICQEAYAGGDEVGRLHCEHMYHTGCIKQWLRLKNWCPICKSDVVSSSPSTQSS